MTDLHSSPVSAQLADRISKTYRKEAGPHAYSVGGLSLDDLNLICESLRARSSAGIESAYYVLVPRTLNAENGAKAALIGEFSETFDYMDDEGDECQAEIPVSWTTIKAIHKKMVERFGVEPSSPPAQALPKRTPVELTESAHRLWMCMNGHDINDFYERAEFILRTSLDGLQVGPGNRATVKSLLVEHFEQIAKASSLSSTEGK